MFRTILMLYFCSFKNICCTQPSFVGEHFCERKLPLCRKALITFICLQTFTHGSYPQSDLLATGAAGWLEALLKGTLVTVIREGQAPLPTLLKFTLLVTNSLPGTFDPLHINILNLHACLCSLISSDCHVVTFQPCSESAMLTLALGTERV